MERLDAVRIEWIDSQGTDGWRKLKKRDRTVAGCLTLGLFDSLTEEAICVILSWDTVNKHACGSITIPLVAITECERLECT